MRDADRAGRHREHRRIHAGAHHGHAHFRAELDRIMDCIASFTPAR
jgi:hypothetical protein